MKHREEDLTYFYYRPAIEPSKYSFHHFHHDISPHNGGYILVNVGYILVNSGYILAIVGYISEDGGYN